MQKKAFKPVAERFFAVLQSIEFSRDACIIVEWYAIRRHL